MSFAGSSLPAEQKHYGTTDGPKDQWTDGQTYQVESWDKTRLHLLRAFEENDESLLTEQLTFR